MGRHIFKDDDDDDFDWEEIEKVTKNYKGSADDLEDILIDEAYQKRKKKKKPGRFTDEEG
jgi:hypothetical protein